MFLFILAIPVMGAMSTDIYLPSLPSIAVDLHTHINTVQLTIGAYLIGFGVGQSVGGPLSDGIGRRKPLIVSLAFCFLSACVCVFAPTIDLLIAGRIFQGLFTGVAVSSTRPMLRDVYDGKELARKASFMGIVAITVLAIVPLLGGYIHHYFGWRATFVVVASYTALLFTILILVIPETNKHFHPDNLQPKVIIANAKTLLTSAQFVSSALCAMLIYGALMAWLTAGPVVLQKVIGLTPKQTGAYLFFTAISYMFGALLNARLVHFYKTSSLIKSGFSITLFAAIVMVALFHSGCIHPLAIVIPVAFSVFGSALIFPNTIAGAAEPFPKIAGICAAMFGTLQVLGGAVSSTIIALVHDKNQLPIGIAYGVAAVLGLMVMSIRERFIE